ncbi:cupin [Sphaerisporangium album]|uniref:Cupin n=1 Tax=Sphaerisporangium album TaxID=509200 RepID=A0A367FPY3_9ACTN|nr:cupin domain-containing protein [Sphaerisporangium album]RCG32304.1 cupin [Sphaerisporangium album]
MPVIRDAENRRTETPNAVMTTFASPTQGGAGLSLWRVDMRAGQAGPPHAFDAEVVWTVLAGGATVRLGDESFTIASGDTVIMPADVPRQVAADTGLTVIAAAPAGARAYTPEEGVDVHPGCALPDGDKLLPAWIA